MTSDPIDKARRARGMVEAARLRDKLLWDLTESGMPPGQANEHNQAIDILEEKFPDIADLDPGEVDDFADGLNARRSRKRGGAKPSTSSSGSGGASSPSSGSGGDSQTGKRASKRRSSSAPRRRSRRPGRRARWALRETGIPGASRSVTQFALRSLGLLVGISLLYLILTNAQRARRGESALEQLGQTVSRSAARLIRPVDPLGGGGTQVHVADWRQRLRQAPEDGLPPFTHFQGMRAQRRRINEIAGGG